MFTNERKKDAKRWEKHSYEFGFYFWIYIYTRLLCIRLGCRLNVLLFFISFHYLPSAHCCCRWIKNVICSLFVSPVVRFKRASIPYTLWNCQYYGVTKATLWLTVINTCLHVCTCNVCVYNFRFVISVYVIPILFVVFLFFLFAADSNYIYCEGIINHYLLIDGLWISISVTIRERDYRSQ